VLAGLAKAQKREKEQNDHDKANQINDPMHRSLLITVRTRAVRQKRMSWTAELKLANNVPGKSEFHAAVKTMNLHKAGRL
jgi:hypothetical protein